MDSVQVPETEFSWRSDTNALIPFAGLAVVRNQDREAFHEFLRRHGYELISLDCSRGFRDFRRQLDVVIGYRAEIGFPLAEQESLDAPR